MTVPNYLQTFRRALQEQSRGRPGYARNVLNVKRVSVTNTPTDLNTFNTFNTSPAAKPYEQVVDALERRCPAYIDAADWQQAIEDGRRFLATWGEQAEHLGWTSRDLFGLAPVPEKPAGNYRRLSRYDLTGLVWLLRGRPVIALTATEAAIQMPGAVTLYRKDNKPALGPLGDSLEHLKPGFCK